MQARASDNPSTVNINAANAVRDTILKNQSVEHRQQPSQHTEFAPAERVCRQGGWMQGNESLIRELDGDFCNIEQVTSPQTSPAQNLERMALQQPLLIRNLIPQEHPVWDVWAAESVRRSIKAKSGLAKSLQKVQVSEIPARTHKNSGRRQSICQWLITLHNTLMLQVSSHRHICSNPSNPRAL